MTHASAGASSPWTAGFDNPEAYIPRDRRRALAAGAELPDRVEGAALFADISGFTPLTEALAREFGSKRGPEALTAVLDRVSHAVIAELDRFDGDVIYFSGDAITCWLGQDDGSRATAAAVAMQAAIERVGRVVTPGGAEVQLTMKIAIAVGRARRFVVGDPRLQLIDVLAGGLIDDLAAAEQLAEKGETVLDESAVARLGDRVLLAGSRVDEESGRRVGVLDRLTVTVAETPAAEPDALPEALVRPWLLAPVWDRVRAGRGEFLAELRPAIPVFVRFAGIDYDEDDEASEKLDEFVGAAQRVLASHGGNLLQLTLGDKGAYLYAVFGSPLAHEDDAARAAAAALELRELEGTTAAAQIQVGVAHGSLRSGTYGHPLRRTFVCLGDAVNLAARLMAKAPPGEVYVSAPVGDQAGDGFSWERLPPLALKGKSAPVTVYSLTGRSGPVSRRRRYELPIVGRARELDALEAELARALEGRGRVVGIAAEAGMGKSRLVAEFVRRIRERDTVVAFGECQSYGANASYAVWREPWRALLGLDEAAADEEQVAALHRRLAELDPELVPRAPLLDVVLGLPIADNALTASFDAKLRKASLESLLADCLRARARAEPLVLVLEDCHWIDPLSLDLLDVLVRAAATLPVLAVLAYRPDADLGLERLPHVSELPLAQLEPSQVALLLESKLKQLFGAEARAAPELAELLTERSQGNPFYLEELLNYVRGQGVDPQDVAGLRALQLPDSLNSLILSRVDRLGEAPRRTLKVASVVGRSFRAGWLPGIYPELGSVDEVTSCLAELRALDLVQLDRPAEQVYLFKHVVTQEATYESLPFAIRADLHERVGAFVEASEPEAVERNLDLLAHHYWHSENVPKKREYLVRAGEAARENYANVAAADYLRRALPLLADGDRWRVTRLLGEVLETAGDWPAAEGSYADALALAEGDDSAAAWSATSLAELARKRGEYDEASGWLGRAHAGFDRLGDRAGLGRVLQIEGTVAATRGDFDAARSLFEQSLAIRRELGDLGSTGSLLSNLGVIAEYAGDYERARALHEEGLALRRRVADKGAVAISLTNLGNVLLLQGAAEDARACHEESLALRRETGDPWMIALGEHNLGALLRSLGDLDGARGLFASALRVYRDHGEKWALAFMLEDTATVATLAGEHALALGLAGAGAALRHATGAPRGPADQAELDTQLAPSRRALGDEAAAAWQAGLETGLHPAIELAIAFLEAPAET